MGPYVDSVERYFGRRPEPTTIDDLISTYAKLDLGGVLLGWDAERTTGRAPLDNEWLSGICARSRGASASARSTRCGRTPSSTSSGSRRCSCAV
jgi:hypothetical protein